MNDLKALYEYRKTPGYQLEKCHYNIILKISFQRKAYEEKACRYQLHCVRGLPARKLGTRCKSINVTLAFKRILQQLPANKKLNVGGSGWLSFLYVQWICMKVTEE